jgi:hypothetical protein
MKKNEKSFRLARSNQNHVEIELFDSMDSLTLRVRDLETIVSGAITCCNSSKEFVSALGSPSQTTYIIAIDPDDKIVEWQKWDC